MKKLLTIAVLGLSLSGFVFADDGDIPAFKSTMGQPYDGQVLSGRADHPAPTPSISLEGVVGTSNDNALNANG